MSDAELQSWIVEDIFQCEESDDIEEDSLVGVFLPHDGSRSGVISRDNFMSIFKETDDLGVELSDADIETLLREFDKGGSFCYRDFVGE